MTNTQLNDPDRWDGIAAYYEAVAEPFTLRQAEAALRLAGGVGPGDVVLDIAAGTGALTLLAAKAGAEVLGVDFSPGMVRRLQERLVELAPAGLCDARVMNGEALNLPDNSFDKVFSIFGVMLFPDFRAGLREMARVTRPSGLGVMGVWANPAGAGPALLLTEAYVRAFPDRSRPTPPGGMSILSESRLLKDEMAVAGFSDVVVHRLTDPWSYPSRDWPVENADHLFCGFPLWATMNAPDRDAVLNGLRDILSQNAAVETPSPALVAIGRKP